MNKPAAPARLIDEGAREQRQRCCVRHLLLDIYVRHRQGLYALALSITGCSAAAEDAVHDAFARLCARPIDPHVDAVAYVYAAVRNAALDQLRRAQVRSALPESVFAEPPPALAGPAEAAARAEQSRLLARAVQRLPSDEREVLLMRIYGGLSFAQIAAAVGVPLQTAASRYRRGLQRLRDLLMRNTHG